MKALGVLTGLLAIATACAFVLAGCGGDASPSFSYEPPRDDRAAPSATLFPATSGKSLRQVLKSADGPLIERGLLVEPTGMVFYKGWNRFPLEVTTKNKFSVDNVDIALYISKTPKPKTGKHQLGRATEAQRLALEGPAKGPFPARITTLATKPRFTAPSTSENPRSASVVYLTSLDFPTNGEWRLGAVVRDGNETFSTTLPSVTVGEFSHIPRVGQRAPLIHTPTAASAGGDLTAISTRRPPARMNEVDFASVLGRKPILLLFASPRFSWNGTAGPTVDIAEQVSQRFKNQIAFINVEIYNGNDPAEYTRPQVRAYHLPSQPWLFAINRQGRIVGEVEGAIGVAELTRLVERALPR